MNCTIFDLKKKTVINVTDGKELGRVCDVSFSFPQGAVEGIVIREGKRFLGGDKFLIKLVCIEKIGKDTILVKLNSKENELSAVSGDEEE